MRGYLKGLAKAVVFVILIVTVASLLSALGERPEEPKPKEQKPAVTQEAKKKQKEEAEYQRMRKIRWACKDAVEATARYGHEWEHWFSPSLTQYTAEPVPGNALLFLGQDVRFKTVYGTLVRMQYACLYDPVMNTVDVEIEER